jgi:hypothetical protein
MLPGGERGRVSRCCRVLGRVRVEKV